MRTGWARTIAAAALAAAPALMAAQPAAAGGGCRHEIGPTEAKGVRVSLQKNCFLPTIVWAQPGQTITWVNDDPVAHTVTGPAFQLDSGDMAAGKTYGVRFPGAGIFPYACIYHPGMSGAVVVGTPVAPDASRAAPEPGAIVPVAAAQPPGSDGATADAGSSDAGTLLGVAAVAGATLGAIGFAVGRRRRAEAG